jgi:hypothetical protein
VLFLKPFPVELIMPGICEADPLIWLHFCQAFLQYGILLPLYFWSKKDPIEHTFFTSSKTVDEAGTYTRILAVKPSFA